MQTQTFTEPMPNQWLSVVIDIYYLFFFFYFEYINLIFFVADNASLLMNDPRCNTYFSDPDLDPLFYLFSVLIVLTVSEYFL